MVHPRRDSNSQPQPVVTRRIWRRRVTRYHCATRATPLQASQKRVDFYYINFIWKSHLKLELTQKSREQSRTWTKKGFQDGSCKFCLILSVAFKTDWYPFVLHLCSLACFVPRQAAWRGDQRWILGSNLPVVHFFFINSSWKELFCEMPIRPTISATIPECVRRSWNAYMNLFDFAPIGQTGSITLYQKIKV